MSNHTIIIGVGMVVVFLCGFIAGVDLGVKIGMGKR